MDGVVSNSGIPGIWPGHIFKYKIYGAVRIISQQHSRIRPPILPKELPKDPVASALGIEPTEEIATAMKTMANAKAVGPDGLPAELWKLGLRQDRTILLELHRLTTLVWREGKVPQQWKDHTPQERRHGNYRRISLVSHADKVLL